MKTSSTTTTKEKRIQLVTTKETIHVFVFAFREEGAWVLFMSLQLEMVAFLKTVVPITVMLIVFTLLQSPV